MSKLTTKHVIVILAIGVLTGAASMTTLAGSIAKLSNLALAQLQLQTQAPPNQHKLPIPGQPTVLQKPGTSAPNARFPTCNGCIVTRDLANGAVTTANIAPGAVRLSEALQNSATVSPGTAAEAIINCPSNFPFPTGGGYDTDGALTELLINYNGPIPPPSVSPTPTGWQVEAFNADPNHQQRSITAFVICAKTTP